MWEMVGLGSLDGIVWGSKSLLSLLFFQLVFLGMLRWMSVLLGLMVAEEEMLWVIRAICWRLL